MTEGLSAADVMALTKEGDNGWTNNPFIYLVWLALLGGGGLWGGNGRTSELQNAITRSDLFEGFNIQDINGQLRGIASGICDGFYATNSGLKDGFYGIQAGLAENRFASQNCCCELGRSIDAVRAENYKNTCEITSAIHAEGEATRALIQENAVQALRDKLADKDRDLMSANFQLSQQAQNATLLGAIRPFPIPAYITCSPYTSNVGVGMCGCAC